MLLQTTAAKEELVRARARSQNAPLRKILHRPEEPVFFIAAQALEASGKNALAYDECASGRLYYFIHADHLDTPRVMVDRSDNLRWRWMAEPFGTTAPENNPSGLGNFTQNLRFPGQYADSESGLFYNWFRSLDTTISRYTQPDPIGLAGGDMSLHAYVGGNPIARADPSGLGPIVFLACTAVNLGYHYYHPASASQKILEGTQQTKALLQKVNREIAACPMEDTNRMKGLTDIQKNLATQLVSQLYAAASAENKVGLGDVARAAMWEGGCALLGLVTPW